VVVLRGAFAASAAQSAKDALVWPWLKAGAHGGAHVLRGAPQSWPLHSGIARELRRDESEEAARELVSEVVSERLLCAIDQLVVVVVVSLVELSFKRHVLVRFRMTSRGPGSWSRPRGRPAASGDSR
jgi:hypothetical protein